MESDIVSWRKVPVTPIAVSSDAGDIIAEALKDVDCSLSDRSLVKVETLQRK